MGPAIAIFISLLFLSAVLVAVAGVMAYRLAPEPRRRQLPFWLLSWSIKGLLIPMALWTIMNLGISWNLQPFLPEIQAAQNSGGPWVSELVRALAAGLFIVSSYWTAITLSWALAGAGRAAEGEPRASFKALCWTCSIGLALPAAIVLLLGGWPALGLAAAVILIPMAGYAPAILQVKKLPPMYARAVARIKFGKYTEAEWEIIRELEKCEDDFEGWMMLAELYANHFHNLAEAEQTVLEICDHPKVTPPQFSIALHRLADWYLKLAGDPNAARRALQIICDRLKGTHLARMAQLRMNQLPATAEELRQQQEVAPIHLPALGDNLDEAPTLPESALDRRKAANAANACVEKLKQDPNNVPAREKLARLFTEQLNQAELGIEQMTLLLDMPGQPEAKRVEWLGLIAAWHIKYRQDPATGRKMLERLIQQFPQSTQAVAARRRIQLLDSAAKQAEQASAPKPEIKIKVEP